MITVRTIEELLSATVGSTVTYFSIKKKESASELHEGIVQTINSGKQYGNKTVVAFWHEGNIANFIEPKFIPNIMPSWDEAGCLTWCEQQNIDIVFVPDATSEIAIYDVSNLQSFKDTVNSVWTTENYDAVFENLVSSEKTKIHCIGKLITNSGFKHIYSKKDGIARYVEKHFMDNNTNSRAILVDAIKAPDGIYYSTPYFQYTTEEKAVIAQIEPAMIAFNYSNDIETLKSQITALGTDVSLNVQYLKAISDIRFVETGKKIVEIKFSVGVDPNIKYDNFAIVI